MKNTNKNKKNQTFDVYPHLAEYQYITGIPSNRNKNSFFSYDDYLTDLITANTGLETEKETTYKPYPNSGFTQNKDGIEYTTPEFIKNNTSPLASVLGLLGDKSFLNYDDPINPATGQPYSRFDYTKTKITNTTDQNAVIDPDKLKDATNWYGGIKKDKNNASDLLMTQTENKSRYFNKLADYHSKEFLNKDKTSMLSKQEMDPLGNITYSDVTKDVETPRLDANGNPIRNPAYVEGVDNSDVDKYLTDTEQVTRKFNEANDMTAMDKVQQDIINKGETGDRIQFDPNENANKYTPTTYTSYDAEGNKVTAQPVSNVAPASRYGGSNDLREFTQHYKIGGQLPKAQEGTGEVPEEGMEPVSEVPQTVTVNDTSAKSWNCNNGECVEIPGSMGQYDTLEMCKDRCQSIISIQPITPDQMEPLAVPATDPDQIARPVPEDAPEYNQPEDMSGVGTLDPVIEQSYGDTKKQSQWNKFQATTNTGLIGKAKNAIAVTGDAIVKVADVVDTFATANVNDYNKRATAAKTDEAMDVFATSEAIRTDKGDHDLNSGDHRVNTLGYGDGPRGQIAQMGQEISNNPPPDYSYLQEFLNDAIIGYNPKHLMMQSKNGGEIIDADINLIKELMAAGIEFEMI
jgi:hypothetical protein